MQQKKLLPKKYEQFPQEILLRLKTGETLSFCFTIITLGGAANVHYRKRTG